MLSDSLIQTLKEKATTPNLFLSMLQANDIDSYNDYLLFNLNERYTKKFLKTLTVLHDDDVWTVEELKKENMMLVAQTIDMDYILSSEIQTLVIPISGYTNDSEWFDMPIGSFLYHWHHHDLSSHILAC